MNLILAVLLSAYSSANTHLIKGKYGLLNKKTGELYYSGNQAPDCWSDNGLKVKPGETIYEGSMIVAYSELWEP